MNKQQILIAALALTLFGAGIARAQVDDATFVCFPSCKANDGRMMGTSTAGFANFNDLEGVYPLTLKMRLRIPATVAEGTPVTVGLFDPDGRGPTLNKLGGQANALWDADFDGEIDINYRLCHDADVDFECDFPGVYLFDEDSTDLAAYDDSWYTFTTTDLASATNPNNLNRFWLLEITQANNFDQSWNMFKVAFSRPGSINVEPNVAFAFGVPVTSCTDFDVLFNGQGICSNPNPDFSDTTYDGTWNFKTFVPENSDGSLAVNSLTVWDGDFDFGNRPRTDWMDGTEGDPITESVRACYTPGSADESAALPDLDDNDLNTDIDLATGFTEVPPQLLQFGGGAADIAAFGVEMESSAFSDNSLEFGNCYKLGAPPENWTDDELFGTAYFLRETKTVGDQVAYKVVYDDPDPGTGPVSFENTNPSGNVEWEKFTLQLEASPGVCPDTGTLLPADSCLTEPLITRTMIDVVVEGMDILNINHMVFPICVDSDDLYCLDNPEGGPCAGKVTDVTFEYLAEGSPDTVYLVVTAKNANDPVFAGYVSVGESFRVVAPKNPTKHAGTLGTEITLERYTDESKTTLLGSEQVHTSCSQAIGAGYRSPSCNFEVLRAYSKVNGLITAVLDPNDDNCPLNDIGTSGGGGGKKARTSSTR